MKRSFILCVLLLQAGLCGCAQPPHRTGIVYQVSTIGALARGVYDGEITCGEWRRHGDFGIGTFDRLDGEMIFADGIIYQARADGSVRIPDDRVRVPFAAVTFFTPDRTSFLGRDLDLEGLEKALDGLLPTENILYAIKVEGSFQYVKTRSIPAQDRPFRPLAEAVKEQRTHEFKNTEGMLVGLRCPAYMKEINVPGCHFHFITRDKRAGGHVLECRLARAQAAIDEVSEFRMVLPFGSGFYRAHLGADAQSDAAQVEKGEYEKAR